MSLSDQNPVDIGAEFGFLPNLITNCIIIGTGIGGKKCRLMYNPGQITADGKSVSYWTSSNISQPTYILYTSSVCIYRFKTPVTFISLSLSSWLPMIPLLLLIPLKFSLKTGLKV
jgi:hypothetical protein